MVRDGVLCNSLAQAAELGSDFRAELEAAALQVELCQDRATNDFAASRLVVNVRAVKKVGKVRQTWLQGRTAGRVPDGRAVHRRRRLLCRLRAGATIGEILRVIFQIGILDEHVLAAGVGQGSADGRSFAVVLLVEHDCDVVPRRQRLQLFARAVGRAIVDDDDFFFTGEAWIACSSSSRCAASL